jgi:hypothetical protein
MYAHIIVKYTCVHRLTYGHMTILRRRHMRYKSGFRTGSSQENKTVREKSDAMWAILARVPRDIGKGHGSPTSVPGWIKVAERSSGEGSQS